jgi:hypothetical protein
MTLDIQRLIAPRSIALIGAGAWTDAVAAGNVALGLPRHHLSCPPHPQVHGHGHLLSFGGRASRRPRLGLHRRPQSRGPGRGGRLGGTRLRRLRLLLRRVLRNRQRVGAPPHPGSGNPGRDLPFFGPNCYGFVNFFDKAAMLPDQVVGKQIERGVALICQSGTIALTLMFNGRSVPIGCLFSVGNQTRLAVEDLIEILSDDPRVTAFGLYLEGVKDAERLGRPPTRRAPRASRLPSSNPAARPPQRARRTVTPARLPAPIRYSNPSVDRPAWPAATPWPR